MAFDKRPQPRKPIGPGAQPSQGSSPPPRSGGRRATPPPPIVSYEDVVAACGHPEKFGLFEDRLDKFRKDRRKKVTDRPCRACREVKRIEEEEALKVRKAEKQQRVAEAAKQTRTRVAATGTGRLPNGSKFEVVYDSEKTIWSGTLTIGDKVFTSSAGGVFKLLNKLDRLYRETLPPEETNEIGDGEPS